MRRLPVSGWIGLVIVAATVLMALISLVWTPYDPVHAVPADRLLGASGEHLMGTDRYGRDVFSRIMAGAQITLFVGLVAVGISALIGVPLGVWAGMRRGWTEALIMRGADLMLAFPALLLAIITGAVFGASTVTAMVALVVFGIFALLNLQTDEFPDIAQPLVVVTVPYPGASPAEVTREIVDPIEAPDRTAAPPRSRSPAPRATSPPELSSSGSTHISHLHDVCCHFTGGAVRPATPIEAVTYVGFHPP